MGFWEIVSDTIINRKVEKANINRRGVTQYKPSQIGGFVEPDSYSQNVVCSGNAADLRAEVIVNLCVASTNAGVPVIVLHQGDSGLTSTFRSVYQNHPAYIEAGPNGKHFDPLHQISSHQISKIIVDTAPQKYALTYDSEAYIDVLTGYLTGKKRMITLAGLNNCPHNRLPALLSSAASNQTMSTTVVQGLQTSLAQGQREANKVKAYFKELYDECLPLLPANKAEYVNCTSITQAITQKAVLNLDIVTDGNILLLRILAEQMKLLIRRRIPFFLVLDNIGIKEDNSLKPISAMKSNGFGYAITGDDLLSLCDGDEKLFSSIVGNSTKWFVFHHGSGISAEKWSAAFSKYQKIDTTVNYGHGYGKGSGSGVPFLGSGTNWNRHKNTHHGASFSNKDEAVIRSEEIQRLPDRGGFVYTAKTREISFVPVFLPQ